MIFTILRLLTHSELGMFHAYRRLGLEGSKQRAINFDWDVVDRVFPSAKDSDKVVINCTFLEEENTAVPVEQWLKRQEKNWRFEGNCPKSGYYNFVVPGVLFAMVVDAATTPATATWVVIPIEHPARAAIMNHGESSRLDKSAMIALYGDEGRYCRQILGEHFPELFPKVENAAAPIGTGPTGLEPDPMGLWAILARAGHRLPSAVADLVDNSISAEATHIDITFPNPNQGGRWLCIRDNGTGMTPDALHDAMRVGNRRQYDGTELGKFGYGLKGASWSQADCLTVVTRTADTPVALMTWDKDHLSRTRRWDVLTTPVDPHFDEAVSLAGPGTAVLLTKMRPPLEMAISRGVDPYTAEVTSIREHLELVFHRYLEGAVRGRAKVTMSLNGAALVANNPMGHPLTKAYDPRTINLNPSEPEKGASISVRAYITPKEDEVLRYHSKEPPEKQREARERISLGNHWNESQGFYFYRLDRLIKWGGWENMFTLEEHMKLLRVAFDFDRSADDPLQVDISKQIIRLPVSISTSIREIVKVPRTEARARYGKKAGTGAGAGAGAGAVAGGGGSGGGGTAGGGAGSGAGAGSGGAGGGTGGVGGGGKPGVGKAKATKGERPAIRLVDTGTRPWERKTDFVGEQVEVTPKIPELVELVQAIDADPAAKVALSKFLQVLERADVVRLLTDV